MKKQIKPEDLHLNEEVIKGSSFTGESTQSHNTCGIILPPNGCDTTTVPSETPCPTQNCQHTDEVCQTLGCEDTGVCNHTQSAEAVCCELSNRKDCNNTDLCKDTERNTVCYCLETDINCESGHKFCDMTNDECIQVSDGCAETDEYICGIIISDGFDCVATQD